MGSPGVQREVLESATIVVKTSRRTFEFEVKSSGLRPSEVSINFEPVPVDQDQMTTSFGPILSDLDVAVVLEGVDVRGSVSERVDRPPNTN